MKDETQQTRSNGQQRPGQRVGREALLEAVSKEQALLARLDREQGDARTRCTRWITARVMLSAAS